MSNTLTHYTTDTIKNPILLAEHFAKSGYFKDTADVSKAVVKIIAGQELGFGPMASISGFHIIQGKPTLSANLMAAAIKRSGKYNFKVKIITDEVCTISFTENGQDCGESTFTLEEAKKAGTQNLAKFPKNMLYARALSNGAKWFCPDVLNGSPIYTPEELGAEVDGDGEVIAPKEVATALPQDPKDKVPPTQPQLTKIHILIQEIAKIKDGDKKFYEDGFKTQLKVSSFKELNLKQAGQLIEQLEKQLEKAKSEIKVEPEHPDTYNN